MTFGPRIWVPSPNMWQKCENNMKTYENNVEVGSHLIFICFSHYFHILGPGTRAWAPKRRRAEPGTCRRFGAWARVPGSKNVKIIWRWYEISMNIMWFDTFTLFSHLFNMIFTFWSLGPRSRPQTSSHFHIPVHTIFILLCIPGLGAISSPQSLECS